MTEYITQIATVVVFGLVLRIIKSTSDDYERRIAALEAERRKA
jgi:hypothetical protein